MNDYLKYYEPSSSEKIFHACHRIYTCIRSVVFSFQGHYLPSSLNEKRRVRGREREREKGGEKERIEEGRGFIYRYGAV